MGLRTRRKWYWSDTAPEAKMLSRGAAVVASAAALWWLASTQPCKVPAAAAAIYRKAIYYQEVKDQTLCKSLRQQTFLMPMVSLWVSPWTKLSTAMSSETQLLNRRPDRKKRSKAGKNKLFFQKLQF